MTKAHNKNKNINNRVPTQFAKVWKKEKTIAPIQYSKI